MAYTNGPAWGYRGEAASQQQQQQQHQGGFLHHRHGLPPSQPQPPAAGCRTGEPVFATPSNPYATPPGHCAQTPHSAAFSAPSPVGFRDTQQGPSVTPPGYVPAAAAAAPAAGHPRAHSYLSCRSGSGDGEAAAGKRWLWRQWAATARWVLGAVVFLWVVCAVDPCFLPVYDTTPDVDFQHLIVPSQCAYFQQLTLYRQEIHRVMVRMYIDSHDKQGFLHKGVALLDLAHAVEASLYDLQGDPEGFRQGSRVADSLFSNALELCTNRGVVAQGVYGVRLREAPSVVSWAALAVLGWADVWALVQEAILHTAWWTLTVAAVCGGAWHLVRRHRLRAEAEVHRAFVHEAVQKEPLTRSALHRRLQEAFPDTYTQSLADLEWTLDRDHLLGLKMESLRTPDVLLVQYVGPHPQLMPGPSGREPSLGPAE